MVGRFLLRHTAGKYAFAKKIAVGEISRSRSCGVKLMRRLYSTASENNFNQTSTQSLNHGNKSDQLADTSVDQDVKVDVANIDAHSQLKGLPISSWQSQLDLIRTPDQPENARILKVSIIGAPNAGKSTLTNMLLGWRVSSTSSKVHTTRAKINAVLTEGEKQIVFLDTPGMITPTKRKKHDLERSLLTDPYSSFKDADIVGVVVDVSVPWGRAQLDKEVLKALLLHHEKKSILILNKIDDISSREILLATTRILTNGRVGGHKDSKVKRKKIEEPKSSRVILDKILKKDYTLSCSEDEQERVLLSELNEMKEFQNYYSQLRHLHKIAEKLKGYGNFSEVFMVSAKDGEGIRELRNYFLDQTLPGDWLYHSSTLTDQDPMSIAQQCVWEKLMDHLPQEVPYNIDVEMVMFREDEYGVMRIAMDLYCYSQRHLSILLGPRGQRIRLISDQAKQELMNAFRRDLTLNLSAQFRRLKKR